jgi:hypothetical protein
LFTPEEQRVIAGAAMSDVDVKLFYDRFTIADYITYDDPEMVLGGIHGAARISHAGTSRCGHC